MKNQKLVREIDGHKFYSKGHNSKEEAQQNRKYSSSSVYDGIDKCWYNFNQTHGYQEDVHVKP